MTTQAYTVDQHGDLVFVSSRGDASVPYRREESLALIIDEETGTILAHGREDRMRARFDKMVSVTQGAPDTRDLFSQMVLYAIPVPLMHVAPIRDEVNKAHQTTGYAAKLRANLQTILEATDPTVLANIRQEMAFPR